MIYKWMHVLPFVSINTAIVEPLDPDAWEPKCWGTQGFAEAPGPYFFDDSATFQTDNVQPGDLVYLIDNTIHFKLATTVYQVIEETVLTLNVESLPTFSNCVYKIGKKQHHTQATIAAMIDARGTQSYSILYNTLWTSAPFNHFARDQYGDVYCIF